MPHYNYLIIGGGMTADAAAGGIRELDAVGSIGMICAESVPPYDRPPLSKKLWKGDAFDSIWRHTSEKQVVLHFDRRAEAIDLRSKRVNDNQGNAYTYDKLLLATGCRPRLLPFGDGRVIYFRTAGDYQRLRALSDTAQRFVVIGGGFIGSEIAAALAMNKKEVTMIFPGTTIGGRLFPHDLGESLNELYRSKGVALLPQETVAYLREDENGLRVEARSGRSISADGVVAGIGVDVNIELAQRAGLHVDNGIVVDEFLRTTHPDIYAAGDVATFYNPALGRAMRVEHEDNANTMGRAVGRNMADAFEPYHHLPFFYSDLFEAGYEAVGTLDARLATVAFWKDPYQEGVIYYLHEGRIRGVLLWNVWGQVDYARKLINERGVYRPEDLQKTPEEIANLASMHSH